MYSSAWVTAAPTLISVGAELAALAAADAGAGWGCWGERTLFCAGAGVGSGCWAENVDPDVDGGSTWPISDGVRLSSEMLTC